jgi:hypothetical protein
MLTQTIKYAKTKMNKYVGASFVYGFARSVNNLKITKIAVSDHYITSASSHRPEAGEAP